MLHRTIHLSGRRVAYRVARSPRRRTIGLQVGAEGLKVVLPARAPEREAERAIRDKAGWVLAALQRWESRPRPEMLRGVDGETVGFLGAPLRLSVSDHDKARTRVERDGAALIVRVDALLTGESRALAVRKALERWRRREAEAMLPARVARYARALDLDPPKVLIRQQKARWGSCSSQGVVRLNARLMAHETALIDYVCAHEACHLLELNHSPAFYRLLDRIMPDHRARERALAASPPPGAAF